MPALWITGYCFSFLFSNARGGVVEGVLTVVPPGCASKVDDYVYYSMQKNML